MSIIPVARLINTPSLSAKALAFTRASGGGGGGGESLTLFEPGGATLVDTWAMDLGGVVATFPETNAQPWSYVNGNPSASYGAECTTITDSGAPFNTTTVGRMELNDGTVPPYGNGIVGKMESASRFVHPGSATTVYMAYAFKFETGWKQYATQLKHWEWFHSSGGIIVATTLATDEDWDGPFHMEFYNWGSNTEHMTGTYNILPDVWYCIYVRIDFATNRFRLWVKPVGGSAVADIDEIATITPWSGSAQSFAWVNVYGGGGGPGLPPITENMYVRWDSVYVSYL